MRFSRDGLKTRERFLTPDLTKRFENENEGVDPFTTGSNDIPKAFRVGQCKELTPERTEFQVLLFWRDDIRSEQREIKAEAVKIDDRWLIDKVINSS